MKLDTRYGMKYKPEVLETEYPYPVYAIVLIEVSRCGTCTKVMIDSENPIWPKYFLINGKSQAHEAGWKEITKPAVLDVEDRVICTECAAAGKAQFLCALCKEARPSDQIQKEIGYGEGNVERLCSVCYSECTAQEWGEKVKELNANHKWDYE